MSYPVPPTASESSYMVLLCQGSRADGEPYWAYLQLSADRVKSFKAAYESGNIVLEEYGDIVKWGLGAHVPADIQAEMERDFGVNHDYQAQLKALAQK